MLYFYYMETHPSYAAPLTHFLSLGTIVGAVILLLWVAYTIHLVYQKRGSPLTVMLSKYVLPLGFLISFMGVALSLFYSEVLHYAPCDLCWFQRIFLYPQMFLFGLAWYKKDKAILPYSCMLSVVGFIIALYHHMLQIGFDLLKPCSSAPFAVDCAKPSFIEYGFVTFPFMAVVLFGFLILLVITSVKFKK